MVAGWSGVLGARPMSGRGRHPGDNVNLRRVQMNKTAISLASAMAAVIGMAAVAQAGPAPTPAFKNEKCYGIAKAGKNDCQTAASSCAGTSKRDGQADAWIYVPAGACEKIVGGSAKPKA
jgi:uncharacterized membrane protein